MRRHVRPGVEGLESRALLAANTSAALAMTLTTDRSAYVAGQPIKITLTETNTSGHTLTFADGPSLDGFTVTKGAATIWRSNARCRCSSGSCG
jgi:hypothetical protein